MQSPSTGNQPLDDLFEASGSLLRRRPLIVASNRGPLEYHLTPDGDLRPRRGSGAIVTALSSITQNFEFTWVANAMGEGDRRASQLAEGGRIRSPLNNQQVSVRYVVTPRRVYHKFYNILCNPLLWFLQHYMWSSPYTPNVDSVVYDAWETGYRPVNQAFCEAIISEASQSTTPPIILVQDYHLYLTTGMIKEKIPEAIVEHFIHIPWPAPHFWQLLPATMRSAICSSLCKADIVGFQSMTDIANFLESCRMFLPNCKVDHEENIIEWEGGRTLVRAYPTSIDAEEVRKIAASPRAMEFDPRIRSYCGEQTIVRVDRVEPSKNIVRGFRGYQILLAQHPELHGRVKFLAFLVPSRTHVKQYERYQEEIDALARNLNTTYGTDDWMPIEIFYENNYTQALAGMRLYDVLLVNPVADGMNLVAKEGPVVNTRNGVLVLSEATGAYDQLKGGAIAVAPADLEGLAHAFYQALTMPSEERKRRNDLLIESIETEDVTRWIHNQITDISRLL